MARLEPSPSQTSAAPLSRTTPALLDVASGEPLVEIPCDLCGKQADHAYGIPADAQRPDAEGKWDLRWCENCSYGFLWPRPEAREVPEFYAIQDYYTHSPDGGWAPIPKSLLDRARIHLAWRRDRGVPMDHEGLRANFGQEAPTLCEIGCGSGADLEAFARVGFVPLGVDPDAAARSAASERNQHAVDGTLEDLPPELAERQFDLVLLSHVLEHGLDIHKAIAGLRNLIAPGGLLVVEVPNHSSLGYQRAKASWAFTDAPRHLNFFTPESLESALCSHGFEVVTRDFYGYCRQFSNEWVEAERRIREVLEPTSSLTRPLASKWESWKLLAQTAFAKPELKYDSVRLTLRVQQEAAR